MSKEDVISLLIHADSKEGKALALTTPVVTPSGWTTIGDLSVGDVVFDGNGEPTTVVALSPVWHDRPCYEITLIEGDKIIADADHIWLATPKGGHDTELVLYRTTQLISGKGNRKLPWTPVLNLPDKDLSIPPYVLGLWLGDGTTKGSQICAGPNRADVLERCIALWGSGEVRQRDDRYLFTSLPNLITELRKVNAIDTDGKKQIPAAYLRAGVKQRQELLAGLIDSDGHVSSGKAVVGFSNTNKSLIDDVYELTHSLGLRARIGGPYQKFTVFPDKTRIPGKPMWNINIRGVVASDNLTYRGDRQHIPESRHRRFNRITITSVEKVDSVPVRCIQVANSDGMFLVGRSMIPTHNSTLTSTAPFPLLVLDAEGSWKFIDEAGFKSGKPLRKKTWDPLRESIPRHDGSWDVVRVHVDSWQTMTSVYQHLSQSQHDFKSLVLDSITEVQRRCKTKIKGTEQMQIQQWGQLLDQMDGLIRGFRDLMFLDTNPITCVIFVAETKMDEGKWRPYMQGQIRYTMPYWVDICGYLFTEQRPNGDQTEKVKRLLIGAGVNPAYVAGERVQGRLPDIIDNPNISDMLARVYPNREESK